MNRAKMKIQFSTCILFSICIIVILLPNLATASIIPSGDIDPPYPVDSPDPWNLSNELRIGVCVDVGSIEINNGSQVNDQTGIIAFSSNLSGTVTVTGQNSQWLNSGYISIGRSGIGEMVISDGGYVYSSGSMIGEYSGSSGSVTVNGQNSQWENSAELSVGYSGEGEMVISDGGNVENTYGYIGYDPGSSGMVIVDGIGSLWSNSEQFYVGYKGDGEMVISNGGTVINLANCYIGYYTVSSGSVTITGQDSLWQNSGYLYVGGDYEGWGGTGLLNISNGGTVVAEGSVFIWPTGTLCGDGRLVSDHVYNYGGTIKPGNSIGTLTIDGNLIMDPGYYEGSVYEVEVDNSGNSDLLSVTGDVDVGGTIRAISTDTITDSQQYTIIEANDVTGAFDAIDTALLNIGLLFPDISLNYVTDSVMLQIDGTRFDDPSVVQTDNQSSLGRALQQIAGGGGNPVTTALQHLENADQVRGAYDELCGQTRPQLTPVTAADTSKFMGIVSDRLNYASESLSYYGYGGGPLLAMAQPDKTDENTTMYDTSPNFALGNGTRVFGNQKWGFWGKGYGVFGDRETESGVPGYDYTVYGTSFGLDYQITDSTLLGITAGYSDSDVDSSLAGNNSDISGTHIGIYGNKNTDDWHFDSILTYSFLEYETERFVYLMGERLRGDTDGQGISGYLEARYDWRNLESWFLQPLAAFQFSYLDLDSYTESSGTSSLGYDDQSYNSCKGSLGMKMSKELFKGNNDLIAHIQLRGRWVHEFGDDNSSVDAHFASDPGVVFKVSDEDIARDSAVLGAGLNIDLSHQSRLSLGYDTQLNNDDNMHLVSAMFVYRW